MRAQRGRVDLVRERGSGGASRRWRARGVTALAALLAILLAACSAPPANDREQRVAIDGYEAEFVTIRQRPAVSIVCTGGAAGVLTVSEAVGRTTDGARYFLYTPNAGWNGDLVLYARGYVPPGELGGLIAAFLLGGDVPPAVQDVIDLRNALLCAGYAVALSSYADDGYAVAEGVRDTHLLIPLFAWYGLEPDRTFLVGHSMGGLVVTALLEGFPARYGGALATCGPVGGSLLQMNYLGSVRVAFDHLFAGVIDGTAVTPTDQTLAEVEEAVRAAAAADPDALAVLAGAQVSGLVAGAVRLLRYDPAEPDDEAVVEALIRALFYEVVGKADVLERGGGSPLDTRGIAFVLDGAPIELPTFAPDPAAQAYFVDWYQSRGSLDRPLRLVHSEFDADVPAYHVDAYLAALDDDGRARVETRVIAGDASHCALPAADMVAEFLQLVESAGP